MQRLKIAQLHGIRFLGQNFTSLHKLRGGLRFTFCIDDLGAPLALGLGLKRNRADHAFVDIDMLNLDICNLYAPRVRLLVEYLLNVDIQLISFREHFIQFMLAKNGS